MQYEESLHRFKGVIEVLPRCFSPIRVRSAH